MVNQNSTGEGDEYQYQVTRNFLTELFDGETYSFALFKISFLDWMALLTFGILTLSYFGCWKEDKVRMVTLAGVLLTASCLIYVQFLQLRTGLPFP